MRHDGQSALRQRQTALRFSMMLWTAGGALVVFVFAMLGFVTHAPREYWTKGAVVVAVILLVLRQITRRLRVSNPKSAQPDPLSRLNLDQPRLDSPKLNSSKPD